MNDNKEFKVRMDPLFMEQLSKLPEKDREEILAAIRGLAANPYVGTPLYGGPLNLYVIFNWFRRQWWRAAGKLKRVK